MEGSVDLRLLVSLGSTFASVIAAMAVARHQIKTLTSSVEQLHEDMRKLDTRADRQETQIETQGQRVSVLSKMMDPQTMERRHREAAKVNADIEALKGEVSTLRHMHNGRHPAVPGDK